MRAKQFQFGVDIPTKIDKYSRRFVDLEGFLDENYDGEHHMLWDNQKECWVHLDEALELMEKEYFNIEKENEVCQEAYTQLKHKHSLLHDECIDAECDRDSYHTDIASLEKENEELKQTIKTICKDYENHHGMDIRNAEWFTAW